MRAAISAMRVESEDSLNFTKNFLLWVVIAVILVALFNLFQGSTPRGPETSMAYSDFLQEVEKGNVESVTIQGPTITGRSKAGSFTTYAPPNDPDMVSKLIARGVKVNAAPVDDNMHPLLNILISWFPMLLLIGVWIFFMRQMQSGGGKAMGFGKSRARLLTEKVGRVTFDDVAGIEEAKQELQEIVEFLKDPQKFQRLGGKIPRACCWSALPAPARRCWPAPSPARRTCPSSPSRAPTSSRCSWASALRGCAICSSRARRTRPASSSSTRSMLSAGTAARGLAAAMTSASRP